MKEPGDLVKLRRRANERVAAKVIVEEPLKNSVPILVRLSIWERTRALNPKDGGRAEIRIMSDV